MHASTASIIPKSELRIENSESRILSSDFGIQSPFNLGTANSRTQNSEFRKFRTQNSELRIQNSEWDVLDGSENAFLSEFWAARGGGVGI